MQEKSYKNSKTSLSDQIKDNLVCFRPVVRSGWIIKFSIFESEKILLMMVSKYTAQTFIRYFCVEDDAVEFINMMVMKNSHEIQE
jgi:hypothetical protein